jgi:hypothetical protein
MERTATLGYHGRPSNARSPMTPRLALAAAAMVAGLAGCAVTSERYGSTTFELVGFCDPAGLMLPAARVDVPELAASPRRDVQPAYVDVPELRPLRGSIALDMIAADLPELAAPQRVRLPARYGDPTIELPPTRGAPSLASASLGVPALPAPASGDLAPVSQSAPDLAASTRSIELGARYEPAVDESRACAPALAIASTSCRLPARALLRERARRAP